MERRRFLTALGTAGAATLAGCIGGGDDVANGADDETGNGTDDGTDGDTPTDAGTDNGGDASGDLGDPGAVVESFLTAAAEQDVDAAAALLHPSHPFHPDNLDDEMEFERSLGDVTATTVDTELLTEDVTVDTVTERVTGAEFFFDEAQLTEVLDDGRSALVEATATGGERPLEYLSVVASHDGEWRILWQGEATDTTEPTQTAVVEVTDDGKTEEIHRERHPQVGRHRQCSERGAGTDSTH